MLTAQGCAARRKRLWDALPAPCDALIMSDPQHLIYFASYVQTPFSFRSNDAGALLVLEPDRATLVADNLLDPFLDRAHVDQVIAPTWYEGKRSAGHRQALLIRSALDVLRAIPVRRIGIEPSTAPAGVLEGLREARQSPELVDLEPLVRRHRRAKDADEIDVLRRSVRAGEAGFAAALNTVEAGMTEFDVFLLVQLAALEDAGEPVIVYGDFEAQPRQPDDLPPPAHRKLQKGELFILDFSVVVSGYRADFANTIAVGGAPSELQSKLFEGCLAALAAGEAMLRPGIPARAVDAAVRTAFAARELDRDFPSHSGHGIGLSHPEPPFIVPESDDVLIAGDVVTLEPGQYGPPFGGMRIERNYVITASGYETLTHHEIALAKGEDFAKQAQRSRS